VRQDERKWIGPFTAHVDEVDADVVDVGLEVRELVERLLLLSPVVTFPPIREQFPEVVDVGACVPPRAFDLVRPPGIRQPLLQVGQQVRRDVDLKRPDVIVWHDFLA
jgi:hypothetical protein